MLTFILKVTNECMRMCKSRKLCIPRCFSSEAYGECKTKLSPADVKMLTIVCRNIRSHPVTINSAFSKLVIFIHYICSSIKLVIYCVLIFIIYT